MHFLLCVFQFRSMPRVVESLNHGLFSYEDQRSIYNQQSYVAVSKSI